MNHLETLQLVKLSSNYVAGSKRKKPLKPKLESDKFFPNDPLKRQDIGGIPLESDLFEKKKPFKATDKKSGK